MIDANGRIKLSPRFLTDYAAYGSSDIVLRCLPEGSVAVYPEEIYLQMRRSEPRPAERAAESFVFRQSLRHFGALTQSETISAQGRITLPAAYREHAGVAPGADIIVLGIEIGVEIWNPERWANELAKMNTHLLDKAEREVAADLMKNDFNNK